MPVGNVYMITLVAVIGGLLSGFNIASLSAILPQQSYKCYFQQGPLDVNGFCTGPRVVTQGGINASTSAGAWAAALFSGHISDKLGRKYAIMIGAFIWLVGSSLSCAAQNIGMLICGRVINGICVGICSAQIPVFISEISPPSLRGRLVGMQQWAITWGIMSMFFISFGASYLKGTVAFRLPWGLQLLPGFMLFTGMSILPESPRWLARQDRWKECSEILTLVHGHGDKDSPIVKQEFEEIERVVQFERQNTDVSYWDLFKPSVVNRTQIGVFMQIWTDLTGMNVMMYYITYIFQMAGMSSSSLLLSCSVQNIINVVMTIPGLMLIDRLGRRPLLLMGSISMAIWLFCNAGIFARYGVDRPNGINGTNQASMEVKGSAAKAVIASSYLFVASFAPTWGPISWVYAAEVFPLRYRGKAVALTTSANWIFDVALAWFIPIAFVKIKWRTYLMFALFCVAMTLHVFFMFPETAGKSLVEIDEMFDTKRPGAWPIIGTPAWRTHKKSIKKNNIENGVNNIEADNKERW